MQTIGLVAAGVTFGAIWFGHVSVRVVEYRAAHLRVPQAIALLLGVALVLAALLTANRALSGAFGIVAMTLFFDAVELGRQERRVAAGHAPANPDNPRHRPLLASGRATTMHRLDREPPGQPATADAAARLLEAAGDGR